MCHDTAWRSSNPSRTSPRAAASRSSTALAAALESVPGAYLLDRTSDPSHNRSVFTLAGEDGAGHGRAGAARRRCPRARSTWSSRPASIRASAPWTSCRSCRSARPRWRRASASPATSAGGSRRASTSRSISTPPRPPRPDRVKLADVRRGQYEGLRDGDRDPRPRAGLRPGPDAPARRGDVRRGAALPHRLEHQPRLGRPRAGQADRAPDPRVVRRPAGRPGQGLLHRGARLRPGLDEPPRLRADAALGGLGDGRGRGRRGRRGARASPS